MYAVGRFVWAIAEARIPSGSRETSAEMTGHEVACLLNTTDKDAHIRVTIYFSDREPIGPYRLVVPARRSRQLRFCDLQYPEPIPSGADYSSVICSDVPIVVQHARIQLQEAQDPLPYALAFSQ